MRPNLITRLKEEWNNLDPVDPLRGLIADAIDALAEAQPSKPLTDEQIEKICPKFEDPVRREMWVLGFKAAHGIMSVPDGKGDA